MIKIKIMFLLLIFTIGFVFSAFAEVTVYQCNNDGVVTTIHEDENGFSWSIVDHNGEDPELLGSGYTSGAYWGSCPQVSG
jgi:hypothetical protein